MYIVCLSCYILTHEHCHVSIRNATTRLHTYYVSLIRLRTLRGPESDPNLPLSYNVCSDNKRRDKQQSLPFMCVYYASPSPESTYLRTHVPTYSQARAKLLLPSLARELVVPLSLYGTYFDDPNVISFVLSQNQPDTESPFGF